MRFMRIFFSLLGGLVLCCAALAQPADDRPALSGAGGAAGIGQYPPSTWGVTATTITNPTNEDRNLLVTFNFEDSPTLQFGAEVWVPAQCRRSLWLPMRTNDFEIEEFKSVTLPLQQRLIDRRGDQPIELGTAQGLLIAARDRWITGIIADGESDDDDSLSAALSMRRAVEMSRRLAYLNEQSLPAMVAGWQGLSGLVITKDKLNLDAAQTEAMRQWVLAGGKLWVMIEQVDPAVMASILGDAWTVQVVDHVPLSSVKIEPAEGATAAATITVDDALNVTFNNKKIGSAAAATRGKMLEALRAALEKQFDDDENTSKRHVQISISGAVPGEVAVALGDTVRSAGGSDSLVQREHEKPVDLARVLPGDMEVTHTVTGWPAAMRKPIGKGWLLVTTVGPRGWMEPMLVPQINVDGSEAKNENNKTILTMAHVAHRPMRELADWFHTDRRTDPLPPEAFESYVNEQIGKDIVGRGTILLVLTLFCLVLGVAGWWLSREGRLEHLAWIGAAAAVVVAIVLIVIGRANQTSVPMTVAQAQFVQVAPDQQQAIATGRLSIYNPGSDESDATLAASAGGLILPELSGVGTRNIRMVWTDVDRWKWEGVAMPGGANCEANFERVAPLNEPVRAVVTFDESGVTGAVSARPFGELRDMLIATPAGAMTVRGGETKPGDLHGYGGSFVAKSNEVLAPGQYAGGGVIGDVQARRQEVLRQLLGGPPVLSDDAIVTVGAGSNGESAGRPAASARRSQGQRGAQYPDSPVLLGWAKPLPTGFVLPKAEHEVGDALVSIPLEIQRPAAGTKVTVPSPFLPYRVVRGKFGSTPAVFVESSRQWNASSVPGTLPLAFRLPKELSPLKVTGATFTLDISAPGADVELFAARDGNLVSLRKASSPSGPLSVEVPVDAAQPDENGEIMVVFRVAFVRTATPPLWRVGRVMLEVKGEVVP